MRAVLHPLYARQNKEVSILKRLGMLVVLLVWIMLFMIPCMSLASSGESTVAPAYLYTRNVKATLTISENGQATCLGAIRANSQSDISLTVTLYKKSGSYWYKVASWSNSASAISLKIEKKYTVSQGTYKVVTHGSVTTSAGNTEQLSETSNQITYSAQ
jgi:hypothetical protein